VGAVGGLDLERVLFVDADFKERDGAPGVMDVDLLGDGKSPEQTYAAGPIAALRSGALARARLVVTWCGGASGSAAPGSSGTASFQQRVRRQR
jgi:hypothetical protein